MYKILGKTLAVAVLSTLASLLISFAFVPLMGGQVAGAGLVMTIACPIVISIPASLVHFYLGEKLRSTNTALAAARDELAAAYTRLQHQARRDALTGLLNRATFMTELETRSQAGMHGGLLFLDLDHFKSINDRFGHATGDAALERVGALLSELAREDDIVGRLGGEEFAIFLNAASPARMLDHSQTVREAVEAIDLFSSSGQRIPLGISIGAFHCAPRFNPAEALAASDRNLYRAKSSGRNMVVA
ncbi:GGDEF domain-containing protein [Shinella sp. CPCC 101442]|uniref:GGDEF domain-containing protein n=1 Tax=Shinella sp. CPCC 101442 TaxID=2932265 RepID=UPI002152C6F2|nr:GGDEF domain-containing protein [Shinella sp. CPCC 101442]MCR6499755.1 GGDEF domain-containing protein [Shinella sp. CPCC 101442]